MAVVCNGWSSAAAGALAVARHLRRFILVATVGAALLWSTSQPASSAEKIIADYGGTSTSWTERASRSAFAEPVRQGDRERCRTRT